MNEAIDFSWHFAQKDVESKIKASRDDMLVIMQSEHKRLDEKIDGVEKRLNERIDGVEKWLDEKIDGVEFRLGSKIDQILSMKKWAVGMFVTIMLAIAALAAPNLAALFG